MEKKNILLTITSIVGFIFMITCFYYKLPLKLTDYSSSYWIPMIIFMLVVSELVYFTLILYNAPMDDEMYTFMKFMAMGLVSLAYFMFSGFGIFLSQFNIVTVIAILKWTGIGIVAISIVVGFFWLNIYFGKKVTGD